LTKAWLIRANLTETHLGRRTQSGLRPQEPNSEPAQRPVVDEHTRECLGGLVDRSITADDLIDELDRLAAERGDAVALPCDYGPELACAAMADWAGERVGLHLIPAGEPWRNGYVESFNARIRDECLNINLFGSLAHARVVIADWKDDSNHRRRHSAPCYQPPAVDAASRTHR
jgi:putative transposase